jgi:hypothetical protein
MRRKKNSPLFPLFNKEGDRGSWFDQIVLKILEMMWVEKYQPLADNCYNEKENIRLV